MFRYFLLLLLFPMGAFSETRVTVIADPWCPYNCSDQASKPGYMIDITRQVLEQYGLKLDYENVNWSSAKQLVQSGARDAIVGMSKSAKSEDLYIFPKIPLGVSEACFFTKADNDWQYAGIDSLKEQRFGWINDYSYGFYPPLDAWIQQQKNTQNLIVVAGEDQIYERIIKLLLTDRITTFVDDNAVIKHQIKLLGLQDKIKAVGCLVESRADVYVAFSKQTQNGQIYADALDAGIAALRESQKLIPLLMFYGLDPAEMGL